jgi:hypothetical protein
MKKNDMKILHILFLSFFIISCGYKERGHANTPPGYPDGLTQPGADTLAHPGNIDKDTIKP